jgi:NADPH:quinone reductase-like Zn-dependent oxidoreductase
VAAVCDGGLGALAALRRAGLRKGAGDPHLRASGSIGTAAVQLARHFGADVTAVCNTKNIQLVQSLGAGSLLTSWTRYKRVVFPMGRYTRNDVLFLRQLIEAGTYHAVIDRRYPLEDAAEAARYVETQQKTGNVVLTVDG